MKELSIKEKAKRYDEALARANEMIKDMTNIGGVAKVDDIQYIFPELKESEDERIRKEMIFYFTEEIPQCSIQEHSDKMREFISWLKRQEVERIKLELKAGNNYFCYKSRWERADSETFKKGLIYKCNKDGVLDNFVIKNPEQHFIEIKDERIAWLEKQGEQKQELLTKEKALKNSPFVEQKPVWSEEDERKISWIIAMLQNSTMRDAVLSMTNDECIDWLKSLKDRVQPKQEWSKEDEKMYARIVRSYTSYEGRILNATNLSEDNRNNILEDLNEQELWLKYRLKSLRPQNTWKPSEEQMKALNTCIMQGEISYVGQGTELQSLYNDLKKLTE